MGTDEGGRGCGGGGLGHVGQVAVGDHFARHLHLNRMWEKIIAPSLLFPSLVHQTYEDKLFTSPKKILEIECK